MSKLSDKAGRITFDDLDSQSGSPTPAQPATPTHSDASISNKERPRTGVGAFSASLAMGRQIEEENDKLKHQLLQYEDAVLVEMLDPKLIKPSRFANRHELSFVSQDFAALKNEIASAGRNIQAIKVRRGPEEEGAQTYEIIFGHRRHRACLELGIQVAAIIEDLNDTQLFTQMDRENRARADLSPWEQGVMYSRALEEGLFPSQAKLSKDLGVSTALVSRAVDLARLPEEVVAAFPSPLELQFRWAADLKKKLATDSSSVLDAAREMAKLNPRPAASVVLAALLGKSTTALPSPRQIKVAGKAVGTLGRSKNGDLELRIGKGAIKKGFDDKLAEFIERQLR
jgi:ParB family transcriptional regulator, chromosome partitioning protein